MGNFPLPFSGAESWKFLEILGNPQYFLENHKEIAPEPLGQRGKKRESVSWERGKIKREIKWEKIEINGKNYKQNTLHLNIKLKNNLAQMTYKIYKKAEVMEHFEEISSTY